MVRSVLVAAGLAMAYLVGHDGDLPWQVVRVAVIALILAAAWWGTASRPAVRAVAALGIGLVTVPIGGGIGVPHAMKSGVTASTVAGLVTLASGLVLVAVGVAALFRLLRRRAALPVSGAALVVLLVLVWSLGQAVLATNMPRTEVGNRTPADAGLDYRDVEFRARDGVRLSGWYVPSTNGAAVALLHGASSTRSGVLDHAIVLARHGYGVLLYDARGHGRSAGRAMGFGWYGDEDLAGAVTFLQDQADVDPERIGAVGMSMGGEQAIGASASIAALSAVVAEGATNRVAGDKDWLSDEFGLRGALTERVEALTYGFSDLLTDAGPPITLHDAVRAAAPRPVLLIAGEAMESEPLAARFIQRASPDTVELWVVPGAGHTAGLRTHPDEWEARVAGFLDAALAGGPRGAGS